MELLNKDIGIFSDEFIKIIESSNINFLVGSGITSSVLSTLGDIEDLIEKNNSLNVRYTTKLRIQIESFLYFRLFMKSIYPIVSEEEKCKKLEKDMTIFFEILYKILSLRKDRNISKGINIFTTNYDLFIEKAIENNKLYYNDGFIGRIDPEFSTSNFSYSIRNMSSLTSKSVDSIYFNLFKMHGSLNWESENDFVKYNKNYLEQIKSIKKKHFDTFNNFFEKFTKIEMSDEFKKSNVNQKYQIIYKLFAQEKESKKFENFLQDYNKKFKIVNPNKEKFKETVFNLNYHEMLRIFSSYLEKEHTLLIVFGFSFLDEHILKITERCLINPELLIVIFAYDNIAVAKYNKIFSDLRLNNKIILVNSTNEISLNVLNSFFEKVYMKLQTESASK